MEKILFLEKVFLKDRNDSVLRGVEVFNLELIRDLLKLGNQVTVISGKGLSSHWEQMRGIGDLNVIMLPEKAGRIVGSLKCIWSLRKEHFTTLFLANVGDTLIPATWLAKLLGLFDGLTVLAHRMPSKLFMLCLKPTKAKFISVNQIIAKTFSDSGFLDSTVYYGITKAESYTPKIHNPEKATVDFIVLGMLDNAWKGADTAIEAFRSLPPEIKKKSRLHLASFSKPRPELSDAEIIQHPWRPPSEIPALLQQMDVMIVPSRDEHIMRETFSQAMVQGMITALPILANKIPVLAEKLDAGGGLIFESTAELCSKMALLANNSNLRMKMGADARRTALERYIWNSARFVEQLKL